MSGFVFGVARGVGWCVLVEMFSVLVIAKFGINFGLGWKISLCVLHVWLLRKLKKRHKNIDFLIF